MKSTTAQGRVLNTTGAPRSAPKNCVVAACVLSLLTFGATARATHDPDSHSPNTTQVASLALGSGLADIADVFEVSVVDPAGTVAAADDGYYATETTIDHPATGRGTVRARMRDVGDSSFRKRAILDAFVASPAPQQGEPVGICRSVDVLRQVRAHRASHWSSCGRVGSRDEPSRADDSPLLIPRWAALFSDPQVKAEGRSVCVGGYPIVRCVDVPARVSGVDGQARAVGLSPDGARLYVTGYDTEYLGGSRYLTEAYDALTGMQLWASGYESPFPQGGASTLAVSPDASRVFVTGVGGIVAYDADSGTQLWADSWNWSAHGEGRVAFLPDMAVSPDGTRVYVPVAAPGVFVAYEAATGTRLWTAPYGSDLAQSPDGARVYIGDSDGVRAYAATGGAQLWVFPIIGNPRVAVSPDGTRVFTFDYIDGEGVRLVALDAASGARLWTAPDAYPLDVADLIVSPDGRLLYAAGREYTSGPLHWQSDMITVAYDSTNGADRWIARFNTPGETDDSARALAISPDGSRVYVTGLSFVDLENGEYVEGATLAYDATEGTELAVAPVGGWDLAVSLDGARLYVTGYQKTTAFCTSALAPRACLVGT